MKNIPDKKWGGKTRALTAAKEYRDEFIKDNPPLTRKQYCSIIRRNYNTGISGVYRFARRFKLKSGQIREGWCREAT